MISDWAVLKDALPEKLASVAQVSISNMLALNTKPVIMQPLLTLNSASGTIFANCSKAKLDQLLWEEALLDAQKVIELEPSSHYSHANTNKSVSPSEAEGAIRKVINAQLDPAPLRLLDITTGILCDREAQINAFKMTTEYKQLRLSIMKHADLPMGRITDTVATYFRYVIDGSHEVAVILQSCPSNRISKNLVELQKSLNSVFAWYHNSALMVVYLSDIPPSSKSGALTKSAWNTQGWTVLEFLAPEVIRFYQQDWTPYLDNVSFNHKESVEIMHKLEDATGIDACALAAFQPGMKDAQKKLQWVSTRVTSVPEDIAYSLFGIFAIQLLILYGKNVQNALGRLLQDIVAHSWDITVLDWVGQPSEFNSCLPADITAYAAPPCMLPYLSEDEIQTAVSSLRHTIAMDKALKLYNQLNNMSYPGFANCRLHLPCIIFPVTEIRRTPGAAEGTLFSYRVKADRLDDLLITTEERLAQFLWLRPTRQTFLLVCPWDCHLLELPDFTDSDDTQSLGGWSEPESLDGSPGEEELTDSESYSQALRLIAHLGQLFGAFLLAQQRSGGYKRIILDCDIIAQVKDVTSVHSMTDIRTLKIL
ncbi:uncharacterized protein HD556DRAFT_1443076 [Suillus plorans]|uniref:Heterokaryon incompatibility domain-containing protein n=1 Tax=Suillus plorans TaxID=116603 RepID=A0A9P7AQ32_9AGAM|nr:uncharacterized protein HD556DRAFT_1443076 [Suillus plorans]KAG1794120.1 hypothetical protein HD556DRAFT_1443076 [Suillus plorans]